LFHNNRKKNHRNKVRIRRFSVFFFRPNLDESFAEVKELEDDFDANENDDEPLQADVVLVAQMSSNLKKVEHKIEYEKGVNNIEYNKDVNNIEYNKGVNKIESEKGRNLYRASY
jgi:hypothetical protein